MSYAELSRVLSELGRDIPPLGLRRIEAGERRVDVDDLVAFAVALGVTPATLLMPSVIEREHPVAVTANDAQQQHAERLWKWLTSDNPLKGGPNILEFWARALPAWEQDQVAERVATKKRRAQAGRGVAKGEK